VSMMQTADTGYQEPAGSNPLVWVKRLEDRLNGCQKDLELYDRYYEGEHRLAVRDPKFRSAFGDLFRRSPTTGATSWSTPSRSG
jgi:hypothetical protein